MFYEPDPNNANEMKQENGSRTGSGQNTKSGPSFGDISNTNRASGIPNISESKESYLNFSAVHSREFEAWERAHTAVAKNCKLLDDEPSVPSVFNDIDCRIREVIPNRRCKSSKKINQIIQITDKDPPSPLSVLNRRIQRFNKDEDENLNMSVESTITSPQRRLKVEKTVAVIEDEQLNYKTHKNDYICGVKTTRATNCKRRLCCRAHTYEEKLMVPRSKPLVLLLQEEQNNTKEFLTKRRIAMRLAKDQVFKKETLRQKENSKIHFNNATDMYEDTSPDDSIISYGEKRNRISYPPVYYPTSATCNEDSNDTSERADSSCHNINTNEIFNILKDSIVKPVAKKKLYVHSLSRSSNREEKVAYLHYQLKGLENMSISSRLQAFFHQQQRQLRKIYNELGIPEIFTPKQNI